MPDDDALDPLIGTKLGPCRLEMRLAAGGMGVVYRARHTVLNEDVAVKVLAPALAQDQEYVTRFFREAGAAGGIDHPNVVRVIDVGRSEDRYYLVMEYVEGATLDRVIDEERKISLERATKHLREIAAGLAAAHRSGTIHRDVKPGNVIISPDGVCHLTDFGLARQTNPQHRKGLTIEGTFLGTPEYASPEQVEGKKLDHRTDLYSLGVTYYHMLSGTLPFLGESAMEIAIKRTREAPRPLESALPGADPRACSIVAKLLQVDPLKRYQSATDLIRDLDAILQGPAGATRVRSAETTKKVNNVLQVTRSRRRLRTALHWAMLLPALGAAFLSGGMAPRGGRFLELWTGETAGRGLRFGFAAASALMVVGSQFVYRREFDGWGRRLAVGALGVLMAFGMLLSGAWIEAAGDGPWALGKDAVQTLFRRGLDVPNRLVLACVALIAGAQLGFERGPGTHRVWISRTLLVVAFVLSYAFGIGTHPPFGPFQHMMSVLEWSLPLSTLGFLTAVFGLIFTSGYDYEAGARWLGTILSLMGCILLAGFALMVGDPLGRDPWTVALQNAFASLGPSWRASAAGVGVVALLGVVERAVVYAGMLRQEKSYRRRF
jgi:hypothetical protein